MKYRIYYSVRNSEPYINRRNHRCYISQYLFNQEEQILYLNDGAYNVDIEYGVNDYIILTKVD